MTKLKHRLLKRQLKKLGLLDKEQSPEFQQFIDLVNQAYTSFDKDVIRIENILEESSKELFKKNKALITERDKTKNKLENIVDNVVGVIFETDLEGNYTFLNDAWVKYSGIPLSESIGRNFQEFLFLENIDGKKEFQQVFVAKKKYIKFIFKNKKDGKLMWFEVKARLIKDAQGNPEKYIGTIVDITNLKETELELQKANKTKDEFLSTMSHEIRTPLNAVTGLANILLMEEHLPSQLENIKALKYSGEHLLGLINDLLDFNKIQSGKININEKDFSLDLFLENIHSHFKLRAQKKHINFQIVKDKSVPNMVLGDQLKLSQVIKNLLSNAFKFTESGSVIIYIDNLGIDKNKVAVQFKVVDTGIGIAKEKLDSIFESFMQASNDTSVKYGGTGLGLAISKKLLNIQGSDLKVVSEIDEGSTFSFRLQFKISSRLNVYSPELVKFQQSYKPLNINVLVAEDNKMNVLILTRFFKKWKVNYKVAENGEQLLNIYKNNHFDLILMDLQMPLLDGYQATTAIRNLECKAKSSIPIIALTAFAQTDIKEKTKDYRMNGFMSKPFNPQELYKLLERYHINSLQGKSVG